MIVRVLTKLELMLLLRIKPYTTLADFYVHRGEIIATFDDFGAVKDAAPPDFLLNRMLLRAGVLLTTEKGIVGIKDPKLTAAGSFFYGSRTPCVKRKTIVTSLAPIIEEAIYG